MTANEKRISYPVDGAKEGPVEKPIDHPVEYITPAAQRERRQKEQGNPSERQKEQERINREDSLYRGGFPTAGHGERQRDNDPGRSR